MREFNSSITGFFPLVSPAVATRLSPHFTGQLQEQKQFALRSNYSGMALRKVRQLTSR